MAWGEKKEIKQKKNEQKKGKWYERVEKKRKKTEK